MTEDRLKELERLEKAATEGPWAWDTTTTTIRVYGGKNRIAKSICAKPTNCNPNPPDVPNFDLIVAIRNALPDLISTIRTLRAENEGLKTELARLRERVRELEKALIHALMCEVTTKACTRCRKADALLLETDTPNRNIHEWVE